MSAPLTLSQNSSYLSGTPLTESQLASSVSSLGDGPYLAIAGLASQLPPKVGPAAAESPQAVAVTAVASVSNENDQLREQIKKIDEEIASIKMFFNATAALKQIFKPYNEPVAPNEPKPDLTDEDPLLLQDVQRLNQLIAVRAGLIKKLK